MECDSLSLKMRCPPPIFRGLLSSVYPIPNTYVVFQNKPISRQLVFSVRFGSSACAALKYVESNQQSTNLDFDNKKNSSYLHNGGFKKIPSGLCSSDWPNSKFSSNVLERDARSVGKRNLTRFDNGRIVNIERKKRLKWYSGVIRDCTLVRSLDEGSAIHGQIIKSGINVDLHLWVSLINFYGKCRRLNSARQVLDAMPERDVVSWTALIAAFVAEGYGSDGVILFCEMRKEGVRPNAFTFASGLKACSMCLNLEFGKQIHAEAIKRRAFSDIFVGSALLDLYAKCGEMEYANKVFFCMPEHNAVSWNALLNGYAQMGDGEQVLKLFCVMKELDMKFSEFTLPTVLKVFANSANLKAGMAVHAMAVKIGCEVDEYISCSLVDLYSKCGLADDALKIFMRIKNPDIVSWTAIISCLDHQGQKLEAAKLFCLMRRTGLQPNNFTLASLVSAATDLGDPYFCGNIHACIYKYGFESENLVGNALIAMYMKMGSLHDGYQVFDALKHQDVVSWNALLSGFHDNEICDEGLRIFNQMLVEGFKPNMYTFISILRSCSSLSNVGFGKQVHGHIIKDNLDGNGFVGTALVDMYAKCRCLEDAEVIFNRLNERDIFTWTVIISGHAQIDQGEKAVQYFSKMQKEGVKPNEFTLASCLRACSGIASLENGRQIHSLAIKSGHFCDMFVGGALIDMYGKCGCIEDAEIVFQGLDSHDTVSWNTIICKYMQHGQGKKALEAFKSMSDEGAIPDDITFIGILSACSHMGMIETGKKYFNSMSEVYGVTPSIDHYACMIDILGRAGKLDEVKSFIEGMELTPNPLIWETVLGACKMHGNIEFGEFAANKLFELEPESHTNYILLSNIFAAKGLWDDVSKVRSLMSSRGVKKEPGCSWVEVDAQFHVFLSQDSSHSKTNEIYQKLEDLSEQLISVGYIPDMDYVLHKITDREKKKNLLYHSERLALAFSLISNNPHKTIRIFKNLRICGDCHNFMKLISVLVNREIVIRDINRFHHFRNGTCSCQDYW
ncbi:pentatricopeptide repeat-containing protein At3g24000, mitochondrial-like [Cornus florida]|uniref:pentatricopeptide repeat-containing protein At3g24000, mitochondrial-like n=1 Tax=Cornus florida TaxID=4283 RepID=UPI00289748C7|nr:pentatricopeptide repeat-containing protein At3g24000, mitochondrial-like [Cornus florida]XP_059647023.1 pentatricopeptide repeat-containing protein At3g24000, mitochondrial-like [Cornus florida]XP_059647030.1 pentatricopeptide repeat-containing protein At3g24000, mitochondrial-like [Cornus florida]XP_059647039.1 pentatricopeptide repeat-containing protein At3g24000, mitochondrial-like [Cornus florida]XP_059647047.1 pentatricopeptide repeat-containing protein At3g24000, mitochondrial-like [C